MRFRGVDGEGITLENGEHRYVLLGVGTDQISDENGLEWRRCFEFLYEHYEPGVAFVGFFLLYDFTQMLKSLPEGRARMLWTSEGKALRKHRTAHRMPHPVEYDGWQFDILGTKRLRLRPKTCDCRVASCKCKHAPWMYVCDVGPFFQTSFLNVIEPRNWKVPVVTEGEYLVIREGKRKRKSARLDADMRKYNALENTVLERVMGELDTGLLEMGIHLPASKWFGPGQIAQAWLKGRAPNRDMLKECVPDWYLESARKSYYGGWFETFIHGYIAGDVHEYDINSAYPDVISRLPCLEHGEYVQGEGQPPAGDDRWLTLIHAKVSAPDDARVGAMLHRDQNGRISRPIHTGGWYWLDELDAARDAGMVRDVQVSEWMQYRPCDCPPPMRDIAKLYELRLKVGKNTPLGMACKLGYNSDYGKFAQSIGDPMYGNPIYASRVTSGCRKRIIEAIGTHPEGADALVMVATDGVYFLSEHPGLVCSDKLGEWSHEVKVNLTVFKPGVYWDEKARTALIENADEVRFKSRGVNTKAFAKHLDDIDRVFRGWTQVPSVFELDGTVSEQWPIVEYRTDFSMVTCLQAIRRGDWGLAGTVKEDVPMVQRANPHDKRGYARTSVEGGRILHRSWPHQYGQNYAVDGVEYESRAYAKRFGMDDPWSDESRESYGIDEDGYTSDLFRELLNDQFEGVDFNAEFEW